MDSIGWGVTLRVHTWATRILSCSSIIAVAIVLSAALLVPGATRAGELADPSAPRTLVLALQVDREGGQLVAFTSKEQAFLAPPAADATKPYAKSDLAQLEIVLLGPNGLRHTRRVTVAGLCLDHAPDAAPEIAGDTIRLHRESLLVEEPEIAGFDRIEIAYYTGETLAPSRKVLGVADLDAAHFTSAGSAARYEDLAIARSFPAQAASSPGLLTPGTVHFPEEYGDPDIYTIYGKATETSKRINVVIVPDGYTYAQKATMQSHAAAMVAAFRAKSPYKEHDSFFNYILVYAYSTEDGTDQCDCAIIRDTAMNTSFPNQTATCEHNDNRCLYYGNRGPGCDPNVSEANIATTELRAPALDTSIVMVNTARYGGCGGARAVYSAGNTAAAEIGIHELGHTLGGLADEYGGAGCGASASGVNTSTDAVNGGWPEWIADLGAPREGGQYFDTCVFRPIDSCEMRTLGPEFCPVCTQQWALQYFGHARVNPTAPLEARNPVSPIYTAVGAPVTFTLSTRLANGAGVTNDTTWQLQGPGFPVPTTVATGVETLSRVFSSPGVYTMTCKLVADTNLVKPEKNGTNVDNASWTVNVCDGAQCCGNGHLEPGETCDDGNSVGGDCCSGTCTYDSAGAACSDGNACTDVDLCATATAIYVGQTFEGGTVPALPAEWLSAVTPTTDDKWTTTTAFSVSAPKSATTNTPIVVSDKTLDRDSFIALPGSYLRFENRYNLELAFDGAVLEISIGGGAFSDIVTAGGSFVTGGYNATISTIFSSPIAGRAAWSGTSAGFVPTRVNLPAAAVGQTVVLRFRVATDVSAAAAEPNGQWIDNVLVIGNASVCQSGSPLNCDDANACSADSCNPGPGCVHTSPSAPAGVPVVTEAKTGGTSFQLAWSALPGATGYDLVYGFLDSLRSSGGNFQLSTGACLANDFEGLALGLVGDPSIGQGFWFLVRGENCGGSGTYDTGAPQQVGLRDAEIAASGNGCP